MPDLSLDPFKKLPAAGKEVSDHSKGIVYVQNPSVSLSEFDQNLWGSHLSLAKYERDDLFNPLGAIHGLSSHARG